VHITGGGACARARFDPVSPSCLYRRPPSLRVDDMDSKEDEPAQEADYALLSESGPRQSFSSTSSKPPSRRGRRMLKGLFGEPFSQQEAAQQLDGALDSEYGALGQFYFAPATQTTVVTTTTTTTTSFPPLVMKQPNRLRGLDPKQYPLAGSPTPQSLRKICFEMGGRRAVFNEAADAAGELEEAWISWAKLGESREVWLTVAI
jgi:hypothetical protein